MSYFDTMIFICIAISAFCSLLNAIFNADTMPKRVAYLFASFAMFASLFLLY